MVCKYETEVRKHIAARRKYNIKCCRYSTFNKEDADIFYSLIVNRPDTSGVQLSRNEYGCYVIMYTLVL
jgi:hypothetical protein